MAYFIWLYLANISNRFRMFAAYVFRFGVIALAFEYLLLAQHSKPLYYEQVMLYVERTWLLLLLCGLLTLLPSAKFIFNMLAIYKNDDFMRNSLVARALRVLKYLVQHDLFKRRLSRGLYARLLTPKRIKWIVIALYLYDLYKGYALLFADLMYFALCYFAFACATWIYFNLTGTPIYYIATIDHSFGIGIAIIGFLVFKIIFLPDWKTIRTIGISLIAKMILHKIGVYKWEAKLQAKIDRYSVDNSSSSPKEV